PNGDSLYRTQMRSWTTLELEPDEVHRIGLEDLESIEMQRREISRSAGFGDDTHKYRASMTADPRNIPPSRDALVERATEDIARATAPAPSYFGRLPRAGFEVRPDAEFKVRYASFSNFFLPTL